jgi:hypothetical protein
MILHGQGGFVGAFAAMAQLNLGSTIAGKIGLPLPFWRDRPCAWRRLILA